MAGDSDGNEDTGASDLRMEEIYNAARASGLSKQEANKLASQWRMEAAYGAPQVSVDTAGLIGVDPNRFGKPTVYFDASGNVAGVLSHNNVVVTPSSMNAILKAGEAATADTLVQRVNEDGLRLYLSDPDDPNSVTTRYTGIPAIAGTLAESAYRPVEQRGGIFGTIGSDFAGMARDPAFWKFLAAAAAVTGGGLALNSALGLGAAGTAGTAGATALPVVDIGLLGATELGVGGMSAAEALTAAANAGGLGAEFGVQGALGSIGAAGAGGMSAAEALALASESGLGAEFGVQGALGGTGALGTAGGMSAADAIASAAEGGLGAEFGVQGALGGTGAASGSILKTISGMMPGGLTGDLIKGGLTLGGLAAAQALAPKPSSASTSLSAQELADMVAKMPSAMQEYLLNAQQSTASPQSFVELFPGFSLPTTGPYYGAGRFDDYYAPTPASNTPISPTGLV